MRRPSFSRGIHLLPSLCTTASMYCGFFSIVRSIHGDHVRAAWAIFFAGFFDLIDGRVARMTQTQSDFGREYDSLVDLASFGLAPAVLVYTWTLSEFRPLGWLFAFLFFACAALRLARYNIQILSVEKRRFQGLPTPPAACLLASLVLSYREVFGTAPVKSLLTLVLVPILAVLMVSKVRYRSFKEFDVQRRNYFYVLLGAAAVIGLIAVQPEVILFAAFATYAVSGPVGELLLLRKRPLTRFRTGSRKLSVLSDTHSGVGSERSGSARRERGGLGAIGGPAENINDASSHHRGRTGPPI